MNTLARGALVLALVASVLTLEPARGEGVLNVGLVPGEDPRVMVNDNQATTATRFYRARIGP